MKKALICGISGQDGAYLANLLLKKGYKVYGTSRDAQINSFANLALLKIREKVVLISMTPTDFRSVLEALMKVMPDEVYNLAGQSSVGLSFDQPVETMESVTVGTLNLLEGIRFSKQPTKFYNAGSSECFGNTKGNRANEDSPFHPRSPYAVAKAAAYWEVANYREAYDLHASTGILFNHESPLRPERFVTKKIVAAACRIAKNSNEKLRLGDISIKRDWGWAPDFVEAMWMILQQEKPDDFVIATGRSDSLENFLNVSFDRVGLNWRDHVIVDPDLMRPSEITENCGDAGKAAAKLGWRPNHYMKDVVNMMIDEELEKADKPGSVL